MDNLYYSAKNDHLISRNGLSMLSASDESDKTVAAFLIGTSSSLKANVEYQTDSNNLFVIGTGVRNPYQVEIGCGVVLDTTKSFALGQNLHVSPTSWVCGTQQNNSFGTICATPNSLSFETGRTTASAVNFNTGIYVANNGHVTCQSGLFAIGASTANLYGTEFGCSAVSVGIPQVNILNGLTVKPFETNVHLHNSPTPWGYEASQNNSIGILSSYLSSPNMETGATVSAFNAGISASPNICLSTECGISKSSIFGTEGISSGSYYIKTTHEGLVVDTCNAAFPSANGLSGIGVGSHYGKNYFESTSLAVVSSYEIQERKIVGLESKCESIEKLVDGLRKNISNYNISEKTEKVEFILAGLDKSLAEMLQGACITLNFTTNPERIPHSAESFTRLFEAFPNYLLKKSDMVSNPNTAERIRRTIVKYLEIDIANCSDVEKELVEKQQYFYVIFSKIRHRKIEAKEYLNSIDLYKTLLAEAEMYLYKLFIFKKERSKYCMN